MDGLSLYLEDSVRERNFEWDLASASDEVIEGLEKMCSKEAYSYTKEETNSETLFHVTLPDGSAEYSPGSKERSLSIAYGSRFDPLPS